MAAHTAVRPAFCGIDVGTQGVRAVVVDETGRQLGMGAVAVAGDVRTGDRHEQSPEHWWTALVSAVRAALTPLTGVEVVAVALDATSGTVLVEDAAGAPRGPALMYDDGRAAEQGARAAAAGAWLWDQLGYRMQPSWGLPKAVWLVENDALAAGDRVVHQSDHLVRRLVGEPVPTDTSNALKTGVDLRSATWPVDVLHDLGVPPTALPDVVLPGTPVGTVCASAAQATGLPPTAVVRAGMTDGCAAQIASGALHPGQWSSALGTTLVLKGATAELVRDTSGAVYCHRHPDGGWLPGGASSTGAGVLGRHFPDAGPAELDALTDQARQLPPVSGPTYPLAGRGERFPFVAPAARGFLSPQATTPAEVFSAICHGLAYLERLAYDVLGSLGADVSGTVSLSGGATANSWWNQLRTDVLGRTTVLARSTDAATGMAVLAAAAPGELSATADRMVRATTVLTPDPDRGEQLRSGYEELVGSLVDRGWLDGGRASAALTTSRAVR
jgi:sugar (pentulose or hexulose) kinase